MGDVYDWFTVGCCFLSRGRGMWVIGCWGRGFCMEGVIGMGLVGLGVGCVMFLVYCRFEQ